MAGTRQTNTMQEGLMAMLGQVSQLMAAPDADLETLAGFQKQLLGIIKKPQQDAMAKFAQAGGVVPGGQPGASPGGAPMAEPMPPMLAGAGSAENPMMTQQAYSPAGVMRGHSMPPVDELRRLISSGGLA